MILKYLPARVNSDIKSLTCTGEHWY